MFIAFEENQFMGISFELGADCAVPSPASTSQRLRIMFSGYIFWLIS
jgi:hypothetical protein